MEKKELKAQAGAAGSVRVKDVFDDYANLPLKEAAKKYGVSETQFKFLVEKLCRGGERVKASEREERGKSKGEAAKTSQNPNEGKKAKAGRKPKKKPSIEKEVLEFIKKYNSESISDVAKGYTVSYSTVSRWAAELKGSEKYKALFEKRKSRVSKAPQAEEEIKKFIKNFNAESGKSFAERYGVSVSTVSLWAKKFRKDPKYEKLFEKRKKPDLSEEEVLEILRDYETLSLKEAAKKHKISVYAFQKLICALKEDEAYKGLFPEKKPRVDKEVSKKPKTPEEIERFIKIYRAHTLRETGKIYGVSGQCAANWADSLKKDERYAKRLEKEQKHGYLPPLEFGSEKEEEKFVKYCAENGKRKAADRYKAGRTAIERTLRELRKREDLEELYRSSYITSISSRTKPKTKKEIERFFRLKGENTYEEMAKIFGVHVQTVQRWKKEFEDGAKLRGEWEELRGCGNREKNSKMPKTEKEIKDFIKVYNESGAKEAAERFGAAEAAARRWAFALSNDPDYAKCIKKPKNAADKTLADFDEGQIIKLIACFNDRGAEYAAKRFGFKKISLLYAVIRGIAKSEKYKDLVDAEKLKPAERAPVKKSGESEKDYKKRKRRFYADFAKRLEKYGSLTEAAAAAGISPEACRCRYAVLKKEYPDLFKGAKAAIEEKRPNRPKGKEETEKFVRYYNTHTAKETAEKYGCGFSTVCAWTTGLKERGYEIRSRMPAKEKRKDIERLSEIYKDHTAKETAKILGIGESTVNGKIYRYRKDEEYAHLFPKKKPGRGKPDEACKKES